MQRRNYYTSIALLSSNVNLNYKIISKDKTIKTNNMLIYHNQYKCFNSHIYDLCVEMINFLNNSQKIHFFLNECFELLFFFEIYLNGISSTYLKKNIDININNFSSITKNNFIFFSFLDNFDNVTSNILLGNWTSEFLDKTKFFYHMDFHMPMEKYKKMDNKVLLEVDWDFKNNLTKKEGFFSNSLQDLFEFDDHVPFKTNQKFVDRVYVDYDFFKWFDISYKWSSYDLLSSFYYQPFFFFHQKIEQALDDYRMISFFRQRSLLFDSRIFFDEEEIKKWKIVFQPLANLYHRSELKSGLKVLKRIFSYKDIQKHSTYLIVEDVQDFALDKNFLHIWNYWIGGWHELDIFGWRRWPGWINFFREKLYSPYTHVPSKHYRSDSSYRSYNTRYLNFAFFPDFMMMWGHYNVHYDMTAGGYNRFFHFGDTYMDSTVSLKLLKYQITINTWGGFDYLVQDFNYYQPTYFADPVATIRLPMILLMCRKYTNKGNMNVHIRDYNSVFLFKQYKTYADVKGEILFPLIPLEWLERLRDVPTIDQRLHRFEWVINLYFGYNQSEYMLNYPKWYSTFFDSEEFYFTLPYEADEDKNIELTSTALIDSLYKKKYNYNSDIPIFFNKLGFDLPLKTMFSYFNEKILDDPGHAITSIYRNENFQKFNKINWLDYHPLIHFEVLPSDHFNWWITIAGFYFFDWNIFEKSSYFKIYNLFCQALSETFFLSLKKMSIANNNVELYRTVGGWFRPYYVFHTPFDPIIYFEIKFLPFLWFFKYIIGPTFLDEPTLEFFSRVTKFFSSLPNPYLLFYISDIYQLIDNIEKMFNEYDLKFLNISFFKQKLKIVLSKLKNFEEHLEPYYREHLEPYYREHLEPYYREHLEPYYREHLEPYYREHLEPYYLKFFKPLIEKRTEFRFLLIFDFFKFFFFYDCNRFTKIKIYTIVDGNFTIAILDTYRLEFRTLPLEFFIFGSIIPLEQIKIVERFNVTYADFLPFLTAKYFSSLSEFEDFRAFILLWTTFQLNKDILNRMENIEYINAVNQIDSSALKINNLEYERYKNFVLKHTLYNFK